MGLVRVIPAVSKKLPGSGQSQTGILSTTEKLKEQCAVHKPRNMFAVPVSLKADVDLRFSLNKLQAAQTMHISIPASGEASLTKVSPVMSADRRNHRARLSARSRQTSSLVCRGVSPNPSEGSAGAGRGDTILDTATSMYPAYVIIGGILAVFRPESYHWFVSRGPATYSIALGAIMMVMGLTLRVEDLVEVVAKRPVAVFFGCAAQYTIMPLMGLAAGRLFNLPPELAAGVILLACCPGGTASNVVTLIANGDVPLSVMMTVCSTFAAVLLTPLLTQLLAGAYVPINSAGLALSTLQVVLAPVLAGAWIKSTFPSAAMRVAPFCPLAAVLTSSLLACSVFSANLPNILVDSKITDYRLLGGVLGALVLLHGSGFFLGYFCSAAVRSLEGEPQRRAVSIEVGMQNSSLGVVLAAKHFASPATALPAALSAILMNVMGSALAVFWRHFGSVCVEVEAPFLVGEEE